MTAHSEVFYSSLTTEIYQELHFYTFMAEEDVITYVIAALKSVFFTFS